MYRLQKIISFVLSVFLMVGVLLPVTAYSQTTKKKTVRVGWYESAFYSQDSFGRMSGYGYEYEQRVSVYTGWDYEYVEGSWADLFDMLVSGEIDIMSDVSYTEERAEKLLYSAESMAQEDYHAFVLPDNKEIRPDDLSTFNGKKIGVSKNSFQEQLLREWVKNNNIDCEIVVMSDVFDGMLSKLNSGEIDVLVVLDSYRNEADILPVCKIGSSDVYFGINKDRMDLKRELDYAMNRIHEEYRGYDRQLSDKYQMYNALNSFLTPDERDWIGDHGTIRVGYRDNFSPFCESDDKSGELRGALTDYISFAENAEKNATVRFEAKAFTTTREALDALVSGEIDCVFPISLSTYDAARLGVVVSDPLLNTEIYVTVRRADGQGVSRDSELKVAVVEGNPSYDSFLMDYFPNWSIVHFKDGNSAYQAVASGEADCGLVSNYRISNINPVLNSYKLAALTTGEDMEVGFAVRKGDDKLFSIINKLNHLIPDSTFNAALTNYSISGDKVTFLDFLRDNMIYVVIAVFLIAFIILLLLTVGIRAKLQVRHGQEIISEAERDALTGLYNRNFLLIYVNRYYKENPEKPMDAIAINIEGFHALNALNGRDFGDEVLHVLGDEMINFVSENEGLAGRVGSDHFEIYCTHLEDYDAVFNRFQSRVKALSDDYDIRIRMGVMPYQKDVHPERLFARAWSACSVVRGDFKNRYMVFNDELLEKEELGQRLQNELERAIEERQLIVYYQPKYDIKSEPPRLNSAEALIRWKHPELGMISPGVFIPLFEKNGQIGALDNYVWAEAARQIAEWRDKYGITLPVSVNLSRIDIFDPNLVSTLDGLVEKNGLNRRELMLEVTESAYTENAEHLIEVIEELRKKGYEIEMDDFGSGYSSLNMLSTMPVDVIKMDIGFIRNIERSEKDYHFVKLILDIAGYLNVPVVAEGVETESQLKLLKDAGCDIVQGYYFSRPLPVEDFEKEILLKK